MPHQRVKCRSCGKWTAQNRDAKTGRERYFAESVKLCALCAAKKYPVYAICEIIDKGERNNHREIVRKMKNRAIKRRKAMAKRRRRYLSHLRKQHNGSGEK